MKTIAITNWLLIGLYAVVILYAALTLKQTTDAAGRGLGTVYLLIGSVSLVVIVGINLIPYRLTKIMVLGFLLAPTLYGLTRYISQSLGASRRRHRGINKP